MTSPTSLRSEDTLQRFLFDKTDIRGEIVTLEKTFFKSYEHQDIPADLLSIFGEFLAAVSLLSDSLKFDGLMTLQAKGDGPVPIIMASSDDQGNVRGILRLNENKPDYCADNQVLPLPELIGNGTLSITIDPSKGERYQGIVPLEGKNLSTCLASYFDQSEQLPTSIELFSTETKCGGILLQCLPAQEVVDPETRQDKWNTCLQLLATTKHEEFFDLLHETMLLRLFHELECRVFPAKAMRFHCGCSHARSSNAIASMGKIEAYKLLSQAGRIRADCQFCGKQYQFGEKELGELFAPRENLH